MENSSDNAIGKAITLLHALRRSEQGGSARDLATATGISRSTAQRILTTLTETGMVVQDPRDQRYRIGPQALLIGLGYKQGGNLINLARPFMLRIRNETSETVGLSVSASIGDSRVFIEEVQSQSELRFASELGRLYPLWSGANGRVLLSGLPDSEIDRVLAHRQMDGSVHRPLAVEEIREGIDQVRREGFATAFDETMANVSSIAVPVTDATRSVVAALSVSGPEGRLTEARMADVLVLLREAAGAISERLGADRQK